MKKLFLSLALVLPLALSAATYGIMINGNDFREGTLNTSPSDPSYTEYMVLDVELNAEDVLQIYDYDNQAGWAVDLDGASVAGIERDDDHYNCVSEGCYSFYIKLKYEEDQLYIGSGSCGGGEKPGDPSDPGETEDHYWAYKGYIDGADVEPSDATKFNKGIAEFACTQKSYLMLIYQVHGVPGVQYMCPQYVDGGTQCTFYNNTTVDKWGIEPGVYTLYLYEDTETSVIVSTEPLPGKKLVDADETAVENVNASRTYTKRIENGQLVIIKNGIRYNVLGGINQ